MKAAPAPSARSRRQRGAWPFAPVALVALVALVSLGCGGPITPIAPLQFSAKVYDPSPYTIGKAVALTLPAAKGGTGALTYSLSPEVPGLEFDASRRTLSGTPTSTGTYFMTYRVRDEKDKIDELTFEIVVQPATVLTSIVSSVAVGDTHGVLRFEHLPEPSGGPAVAVSGNRVFVAGGSVFLNIDIEPGSTVDKLLISIGGESLGYYEIDLPGAASAHRLVGQIHFDLDPEVQSGCVAVTAVDSSGAAGPTACHEVIGIPVGSGDVQITVSWDTDADLDLHVVDPNGHEVYYGQPEVESGGVLDVDSFCGPESFIRNEHIGWSQGTPPPGIYEVRLDHWESCDAVETHYIVNVYNHGQRSSFEGRFTGRGDRGGRGDGRVITTFEVPGDAPPPPRAKDLESTYRGSGDQVFVLNPGGAVLDDTLYTLDLGDALAEVYLIATNSAHYHVDPQVDRLDLREAAAKGLRAAAQDEYEPQPRPSVSEPAPDRPWITEYNNYTPLGDGLDTRTRRLQAQSQRRVAEGDTFTFLDLVVPGLVDVIPATARKVVTDGTTTLAMWVADREWGTTCVIAEQCVTQQMLDAMANRFLRPGAGNDIYDWVTSIFGEPWGPHDVPILIPPESADEIHILLLDIDGDGFPQPGEGRAVGFFVSVHNVVRNPEHPLLSTSSERLIFFLDSALLAFGDGATWDVTDRWPSDVIATLAHEFQHMIHFYQKRVVQDTISEAWLNEMASEVTEDLIADKMMVSGPRGVAYDDPTAGDSGNRRGRPPLYNVFNDIQVTKWDGYLANYGINYALGAYLARNYGGAELFRKIVRNESSGVDAIESALSDLGHDVSFGELLTNWAAATLLSDNTSADARYRYNSGTWSTSRSADGTTFQLGSINLFNYVFRPLGLPDILGPDVSDRLALEGPYLQSLRSFNERTQPPHSNMFTTLGRNTGEMRLSVTANSDNRITVVVKE